MNFAEKIFERATVKGIADYLLYGMIPDRDDRSYETRLDDADLAYEKAAKQYDENGASVLLSAANELVNENANVYMELGLQAGFLLAADLFRNICREKNPTINSKVSNGYKAQEEQNLDAKSDEEPDIEFDRDSDADMESEIQRTVLQQFIRNRLDTALEDALRKDQKYQKSKEKAEEKTDRLTKSTFTSEQWELINDALEDSNASASEYGRAAYQQGFFDAIDFFKDIRLQRRDWA
ncbi:hypothetical protein IMSAGC020_00640 [Lachnospiraceae bacterium]|nr:hypothetical protein IMSAGC020_00640 [Lachnospiraceae bacterium]